MLLAAALAVTAVLLGPAALHLGKRAVRHETAPPATTAPAAPPVPSSPERVCVTPAGLCPIGLVRAGDPCTCPDPLHGNVAGHVEPVGGPPTRTRPRDWPSEDPLDTLYGP